MTVDAMWKLVPLVSALTIAQAPGSALPGDDSAKVSGEKLVAIHACVNQVRQTSPRSTFDAHLTSSGRLRISGTTGETAVFAQCMKDKGYPVDSRPGD